MIIALDRKAQDCVDYGCLQFRTPLTRYATSPGVKWVLDNGAFTNFDARTWEKMACVGISNPDCLWMAFPDVVGCHESTLVEFNTWWDRISRMWIPRPTPAKMKAAFVVQDGALLEEIPWERIVALFLGGSTEFKMSRKAWNILEYGKTVHDLWIHVGRVNTPSRITHFHGLADSIDGSGMARFDLDLERALETIRSLDARPQSRLEDWE